MRVSSNDDQREHGFDLGERLAERTERGLRRDLTPAESVGARSRFVADPGGGRPVFAGEEDLVFASNNYLGLAGDERVRAAVTRAAESIGTGSGASRLVTGDTSVHRALERDLAEAKGTERALVFSSGYATNVGTITALEPDVIFSDAFNHASIIDGCRLSDAEIRVYEHCDPSSLEAEMADQADRTDRTAGEESWLVITDTVFSMDGDIAPLSAICELAERYGAWVMVDEAHATGLFEDGGGIVQHEGLTDRVHVQLGTLSKALGAQGGYIAGDELLIEHLLNEARSFVYSTGLAPPSCAGAREALSIAREGQRREQLWANVGRLRDGLESIGFAVLGETQILPVLIGDREKRSSVSSQNPSTSGDSRTQSGDRTTAIELDQQLRRNGIIAPAIRPPTVPEGTSRLRVTPMATHTPEEIDRCIKAFESAGREMDVI